jgi:diaminohydroxyphosphoribosylaminopyrimidine deaminase/5-amino-6-(5-phosphoribosylamino)uracil reductase
MSSADNMFDAADVRAMQRALQLAALGLETTDPNPRVGCVLVRDGQIVGEGWHERAGEPHAEVLAIEAAGQSARGATAYVTLEPCSHFGRTPPCTEALIRAHVGRVVFATEDPNPEVHGAGASKLRAAGIAVEQGLCAQAAQALNAGFFKRMRTGLPLIRLKIAMSLDGRTALANGQSQWISGEAARADVQRWRARSSAVLTGIGTILADDPRLTVRQPSQASRQPTRVILDARWRTPRAARVFEDAAPVILFGAPSEVQRAQVCERPGVQPICEDPHDLPAVLAALGRMSLNEILVEAGPTLSGAFLSAGLVDELIVYIAPILLGPQARAMADFAALEHLSDARRFELRESIRIGKDLRLILQNPAPEA